MELVIKGEDKLERRAERRGRGGPFMSAAEHLTQLTWGWEAPSPALLPFGDGRAAGRPGCTLVEPKPGSSQALGQQEGWQVVFIRQRSPVPVRVAGGLASTAPSLLVPLFLQPSLDGYVSLKHPPI